MSHPRKVKEWKDFKRARHDPEHIKNCDSGYRAEGHCQVHHLLCVHACSDAKLEDDWVEPIHEFLAAGKWDINAAHNTIGLPKKSAYVERPDDSALGSAEAPAGWGLLPCHMIDHNPTHTTEVANWVAANIWDKLKSAKKNEQCGNTEAPNITKMFENGSDFFRGELTRRGAREGGTKKVIERGFASDAWYHPFSMAECPAPRRPPPRHKKLSLDGFLALID
jgi:hypothetical protein